MIIIKELRKQRKVSQQNLADEIGVSLRTIQHYEKGDIDIPMKKLQKIARFFEVAIADMFKDYKANEAPPKYKLITEAEEKLEAITTEELMRYIISREKELMGNETFEMWLENKAHIKMSELYQEELQKLKKDKN